MTDRQQNALRRIEAAADGTSKTIETMTSVAGVMLDGAGDQVPGFNATRARLALRQGLEAKRDVIRTMITSVWANVYSETELEQLADYYESDLYKRVQEATPAIEGQIRTMMEPLVKDVTMQTIAPLLASALGLNVDEIESGKPDTSKVMPS